MATNPNMEAQSVGGGWSGIATGYPLVLEQSWWCLFVCVFVTDIRELQPGQWDERALRTSVFLPFFLSFFLNFWLSVCQSVSPSVHLSFFSSLTLKGPYLSNRSITSVMSWAVGCLTGENTKECWAFFAQCRAIHMIRALRSRCLRPEAL